MRNKLVCILCLCLAVLSLSACGSSAKPAAESAQKPPFTIPVESQPQETQPKPVTQEAMPQQQLDAALKNVDMSVLCAGLDMVHRSKMMNAQWYDVSMQVVAYSDYDADGSPEVLMPYTVFDLDPQHSSVKYPYPVSDNLSYGVYTDKEGNAYRVEISWHAMQLPNGDFSVSLGENFRLWRNGSWQSVISYGATVTSRDEILPDRLMLEDSDQFLTYQVHCEMNGQTCTIQELNAYMRQQEIRYAHAAAGAYTVNRYDACYQDSLLTALDQYFSQHYADYTQPVKLDVDGDGAEETLFILPDFDSLWKQDVKVVGIEPGLEYYGTPNIDDLFPRDSTRTAVVIADTQGQEMVLSAQCLEGKITPYIGMKASLESGFFCLDNTTGYALGSFAEVRDLCPALDSYLSFYGYENAIMRSVDLSQLDAPEYLCIARKGDQWNCLYFVIRDGNPELLYTLQGTAIYLVQHEGKQCLLKYSQYIYEQYNGDLMNVYSYELMSFDDNGARSVLDTGYVSYSREDEDASATARFFEAFNGHLSKAVVVYDPYRLTGRQWMPQSEADYGTVPETQTEQGSLGFVQIQDPSSWLNLRQGPGTEYDRVLLDPADPDSFVRQALGSPVTILETIETGDEENPVWVKVRITYANREIIGYCSKTYIRMA